MDHVQNSVQSHPVGFDQAKKGAGAGSKALCALRSLCDDAGHRRQVCRDIVDTCPRACVLLLTGTRSIGGPRCLL